MNKKDKHSIYSGMEDVDRSCVHVVIIIGVIFAVLVYFIYPAGILDIPSSEMTAGPVSRLTGALILGIVTILIFIDVLNVFIKR
ncbi:MAG: hypothetical protein HY757_09070 [Nitrospirae bacterium]|nr:hypothetical protein [Nitrospirota bacterium]